MATTSSSTSSAAHGFPAKLSCSTTSYAAVAPCSTSHVFTAWSNRTAWLHSQRKRHVLLMMAHDNVYGSIADLIF